MQRTLLLAGAVALLGGCATTHKDPYGPIITYGCSGGEQVVARYHNRGKGMELTVRGQTEHLLPAMTADGRKFDDGHVTFWNKGDDARLRVAGDLVWQACRDVGKGAPPGLIAGTITVGEQVKLTDTSVMVVKLLDVSLMDAPPVQLAQTEAHPGRLPAAYELQYDAAALQAGHTYVVQATVYDGSNLQYINDTQHRVLISGPEVGPVQIQVIDAAQKTSQK